MRVCILTATVEWTPLGEPASTGKKRCLKKLLLLSSSCLSFSNLFTQRPLKYSELPNHPSHTHNSLP